MKYLVLLLALACGKYESSKSNPNLGELLQYQPTELTELEKVDKNKICHAITTKTSTLAAMNGSKLTFNISETNCEGQSSQDEVVDVFVTVTDSSITLERNAGLYFIFRDAETLRSGIFKSYCESNTMPFLHNGNPVWMNTNNNQYCSTSSNKLCVTFKSGVKSATDNELFRISSEEFFTIDGSQFSSRYGFYTQRVLRSNLGCNSGVRTIRAKLN